MWDWILCTIFFICAPEPVIHQEIVPKGNIYRMNDRPSLCRLRKTEEDMNSEEKGWVCVYDHPYSETDDRVSICYECRCPKKVYCTQRDNGR